MVTGSGFIGSGRCAAWQLLVLFGILVGAELSAQSQVGGIRGVVMDREFDVPLNAVQISLPEINIKGESDPTGHFVFQGIAPGTYTLILVKENYERVVRPNVVVTEGSMANVTIAMPAEFAEMEEFRVQGGADLDTGETLGGDLTSKIIGDIGAKLADQLTLSNLTTDVELLNLRAETSAIINTVGREMISKSGASHAADAMKLVAGASVADDKYAVIRGLSDRFLNTRVNGIMIPTADPDVRAVQLDLFPSSLLDSIRVYKTFTPDLPGNTSGGSVDIITPGPPEKLTLSFSANTSSNTRSTGKEYLTSGQDFDYFGLDPADREQTVESGTVRDPGMYRVGGSRTWDEWLAAAQIHEQQIRSMSSVIAPTREIAPMNHGWGLTYGDRYPLTEDKETSIGLLTSFTYSDKYSSHEDGLEQSLISGLTGLETFEIDTGGSSENAAGGRVEADVWKTEEGKHTVGWGFGSVLQLRHQDYVMNLNYLRTQFTEETALRYQDVDQYTRLQALNESLIYRARSMESLQLTATLPLDFLDPPAWSWLDLGVPKLELAGAISEAIQNEPDRRFFLGYHDANFQRWSNVWNQIYAERAWRVINEHTDFYRADLTLPYELDPVRKGLFKFGLSSEDTFRTYTQDSFYYDVQLGTNYVTPYKSYVAGFDQPWSEVYMQPERFGFPVFGVGTDFDPRRQDEANFILYDFAEDVDYDGILQVTATYGMVEVPVLPWLKFIGGARIEDTNMTTEVHAADGKDDTVMVLDVRSYIEKQKDPTLAASGIPIEQPRTLGKSLSEVADSSIIRTDVLPSLGVVIDVVKDVKLRASWSETIGRPTFKEVSPVSQQSHLGGQKFAGNPTLVVSELVNYDLRLEWNPGDGRLLAVSAFTKEIINPIDYSLHATQWAGDVYVLPFNYPTGEVKGLEFEARMELGLIYPWLKGLTVGGNVTLLEASVMLPDNEAQGLATKLKKDPDEVSERRMKDQPDYLVNAYIMYDFERTGTSLSLFLNHSGETLVTGESWPPSETNVYFPNRIKMPVTTLDLSIEQKLTKNSTLSLSISNLLDPLIREVWQSDYVEEGEVDASYYRKGRTISLSISAKW